MKFEWFVARRYLRSPYRPAVLRLVTAFSVIGVAAITRPGAGGIRDYEALASKLAAIPGVRSVTPAAYQTVLMTFAGEARGVVSKGIDLERERRSDEALQRIIAGKLDFSPDADGIDAVLVGKQLAQEWKVSPGDYVTLTSPQNGRLTPYGMLPRSRRFRVTGVFDSGFYDYDENWCFLSLVAAQGLSGVGNRVSVLEFLDDGDRQGAGRCCTDVDGFQAAADSADFPVARDCDWRDGHFCGLVRRVCLRMDRRDMASDSSRSTGVCGAVCAVSSQRAGRSMDRSRRYGHFYRSNAIACARRSTAVAGGNPAL